MVAIGEDHASEISVVAFSPSLLSSPCWLANSRLQLLLSFCMIRRPLALLSAIGAFWCAVQSNYSNTLKNKASYYGASP